MKFYCNFIDIFKCNTTNNKVKILRKKKIKLEIFGLEVNINLISYFFEGKKCFLLVLFFTQFKL